MQKPPPHRFTSAAEVLEYEIVQEQAAALGRLGRALERALQALRDHEATSTPEALASERRSALVAEAAHALWIYVVQREACGLRDNGAIMRDYQVPLEVQHRMGASPPRRR